MNVFTTERLTISHFNVNDSAFILELMNTPGWIKFVGDRGIKTIDDAKNYLTNKMLGSYTEFGFGMYAVRLKNSKITIGMCGLVKREGLEDVDIGFAFLPNYNGQGYAFEAASATMNYAINDLELKRIVAITLKENTSSIKLLEKIGLQFEENINIADDPEELMLFGMNKKSQPQ